MKTFSEFLTEAAIGYGGYEYPINIGPGWDKAVTPFKGNYVKRLGKGANKGLVAVEFSEKWIKSNITNDRIGSTWFPHVFIGYMPSNTGEPLFIGEIVTPPIVKGKMKGDWRVKGIVGNREPVHFDMIHALHAISSEKRPVDALNKITEAASNVLSNSVTPKGEYSLHEIEDKIKTFLKKPRKLAASELRSNLVSSFEIRYWGNWVVPDDADDSDGDYDWKELDKQSYEKISAFVKDLQKHTSIYAITWTTGEKSWLNIDIRKK